jgi:hypothetical protein
MRQHCNSSTTVLFTVVCQVVCMLRGQGKPEVRDVTFQQLIVFPLVL